MTSYFVDNEGIFASDGRVCLNPQGLEALAWLLADHPKQNKLFYDLDPAVASIIRMTLNEAQAKELYGNERVNVGDYKITYFPNRFFAIDSHRKFVNFGSMIRYRSDVHYSPNDTTQDKINKAKEAESIAVAAGEILASLGLDPQRIISPVAAVVDKFIKALKIPTMDDAPEEANELAYQTIKGNWLEAFSLGYWDNALDYDINGAYGSVLATLLDLRRGTWVKDTVMPIGAVYGFAEGRLDTMSQFHPFIMKVDETSNYTPIGSRIDQLAKSQIDLLHKHHLGAFDIDRAWWWIPSETKPRYEPLKGIVNHLYNIRARSEGLKKVIIRQMIAGIWGRMAQVKKDELGELFNPVWASIVENEIKCKVADTCLSAGIIPIQVAVDGVITDKPLPIQDSLELGGWRLSHKGKCIVASSGIVGFEGKEGAEEFALRYEWLYEQLKNNPEKSEYSMIKYSPITLAKAMQNSGFGKLGELDKIDRVIKIGRDYKRQWREYPKTGWDLLANKYKSIPIDVVMAGGIK